MPDVHGEYRVNLVVLRHGDLLPVSARHLSAEYSDLACLTETELASERQVFKGTGNIFQCRYTDYYIKHRATMMIKLTQTAECKRTLPSR